jgi:hypothetical protein
VALEERWVLHTRPVLVERLAREGFLGRPEELTQAGGYNLTSRSDMSQAGGAIMRSTGAGSSCLITCSTSVCSNKENARQSGHVKAAASPTSAAASRSGGPCHEKSLAPRFRFESVASPIIRHCPDHPVGRHLLGFASDAAPWGRPRTFRPRRCNLCTCRWAGRALALRVGGSRALYCFPSLV